MKSLLYISLSLFTATVFGQELMSFNDCLDLTFKNNLALKTALLSDELAAYEYKVSYGKLLPAVYAQGDSKYSWGREIDPNTNLYIDQNLKAYKGEFDANFNLFSGFKVINSIKLAKEESKIKKLNIDRVKFEITIDLAQKFITILYLQEIVKANQEQIKSSEKQLEIANLKYDSGAIAESELFKIKTQKATEELTLLTNQNRLADNIVNLKQLMNIPLESEIQLSKPNIEFIKNIQLDENQYSLMNKAIEINPNYTISVLKEGTARTGLSIARASRYPTLNMNYSYESKFDNSEPFIPIDEQIDTNILSKLRFTLVIPIFTQFDNALKIKTSKLNYSQSKLNTQIVGNKLSSDVLKAIADTKTSIKKKETSATAFDFAQKSYEADLLKFELGKINITEMNTTKTNLNNSQADLIQATYELLYNNALIKYYLGEDFSL